MIVELAIAAQTSPRDWWDEDDATIATAVELVTRKH